MVALNALSVDPRRKWKGVWRWYSEDHLDCCLSLEMVKTEGICLQEFVCLARCNSLSVNTNAMEPLSKEISEPGFDDDSGQWNPQKFESTLSQEVLQRLHKFRETVKQVCQNCFPGDDPRSTTNKVLVANYSRKTLKQTGDGHFSPIAGYHANKDLVLILDTARFKYPSHWVPLTLLFSAMQRADSEGRKRGYVVLSRLSSAPLVLFELSVSTMDNGAADERDSHSGCYFMRTTGQATNQCSVESLRQTLMPPLQAAETALKKLSSEKSAIEITFQQVVQVFIRAYCESGTGKQQMQTNVLHDLSSSKCIDQMSTEHLQSATALLEELEKCSVFSSASSMLADATNLSLNQDKCCLAAKDNVIHVRRIHTVVMFLLAWSLSSYATSNTEKSPAEKTLVETVKEELNSERFQLLHHEAMELAGQIDGLCASDEETTAT